MAEREFETPGPQPLTTETLVIEQALRGQEINFMGFCWIEDHDGDVVTPNGKGAHLRMAVYVDGAWVQEGGRVPNSGRIVRHITPEGVDLGDITLDFWCTPPLSAPRGSLIRLEVRNINAVPVNTFAKLMLTDDLIPADRLF